MCRYNLHHYPACGHIASFGMESCTNIIMSMRQGKSDMYCDDSSFTHDLVLGQGADPCGKCKAEPSAKRTRDNDSQQQYTHLEGMDLLSNGYPWSGSSINSKGDITKRALSSLRCVLHRCLPLDIPFEGWESDDEKPQRRAKKSPPVTPAELEADTLRADSAQRPAVELTTGCEIMAPPPSQVWSPTYPPTYPMALNDHRVCDRLLTERLLELSPNGTTSAPAERDNVLGKPLFDEVSELGDESSKSIEDEYTYMTEKYFKNEKAPNHSAANVETAVDMDEEFDDDFVNMLKQLAKNYVSPNHLKSSSDEGKREAKLQAKPRRKRPQLAPIVTNMPVHTDISIVPQVTPSTDLEAALNQAISDCASIPSPRFETPDYKRPRSDNAELERIESPCGTRSIDYTDSFGEGSFHEFPAKATATFFQPPSPDQEEMVTGRRGSVSDDETLGKIDFFDVEDWPDSAQEISFFSDNSDNVSDDDDEDLMLAGNEDEMDSVYADSEADSSFENDSHATFDSQIHRASDTTTEGEVHDPEDPSKRGPPLLAPKPVRPLQDVVSHLSDEEWDLVEEDEAQESPSEQSSTKKLDPESSYEAWLQSVKDARREWLAQVPVTYRNGYAIMLNGTICLPMINTETVEPRRSRDLSPPGLDPVPRFHPDQVDYSRFLTLKPAEIAYAPSARTLGDQVRRYDAYW